MSATHHAGGDRRDDHQALRDLHEVAARLVARIGTSGHTLIDRARQASQPDGYPRSSMGGSGAGPTVTVENEQGEDERVPVTSVEAAVIARLTPGGDELTKAKRKLFTLLERAVNDLTRAASHLELLGVRPAEPTDDDWCASCVRVRSFSKRWRGDLCHWCYDNRRPNSDPPPAQLVDLHARGVRITSRDWARHGYPVAS